MSKGILGKKIGMTRVFDPATGRAEPVTVIQAGPCVVLQVKTSESDGYNALQLGFDDRKPKNVNKPMQGHFAKAGAPPKRFVREIRTSEPSAQAAGSLVTLAEFADVKKVDVQGFTKGRGWTGTIKRWNRHRQATSHGNTKHHRARGSLGRTYSVHKGVPKGMTMAGHYGNERVTARGLTVVKLLPQENLIAVRGAVPGPNGGYLVLRQSQKDTVR